MASRRREAASRRRSVAARVANKSTTHYHHPLTPDMSLRDPQPESPRSAPTCYVTPPGRLHTPLRVLERRSRRKHPPRDAKQLLPPVGAGRGGWSSHVGELRASRDDEDAAANPCAETGPEPSQHQGNKTSTLCRATQTATYPPLHLHGVWLGKLRPSSSAATSCGM